MQQENGDYFKALKIIHVALLAGQCLFLAVMVFLVMRKSTAMVGPSFDKILQVVALLVSFGGVFAATSIFKKRLLTINTGAATMAEIGTQYRASNIFRWAMIEAPSLFAIICFFLTGNYAFAALAVALIIFFVLTAPSRLKAMIQLQLSEQEVDQLQ